MNKENVLNLVRNGIFPFDQKEEASLTETSISYIILKGEYAYKIKKEIRLSFLDFSSLDKRKYYCEEELRLNKRLSGDMYLDVLPLSYNNLQWVIGDYTAQPVEYAVRMKRMDPDMQLDVLLKKGITKKKRLRRLGKQIAEFHIREKPIVCSYDPFFLSDEFADIQTVSATVKKECGDEYVSLMNEAIKLSHIFVALHESYIRARATNGFFKECHGDLHTKNIFLYKEPLVFDCVEFRKEFREIDVLNEIAFLCMDLETADFKELRKEFLHSYQKHTQHTLNREELQLLTYFKAFRACIRAKVTLIELAENPDNKRLQKDASTYLRAMTRYLLKVF